LLNFISDSFIQKKSRNNVFSGNIAKQKTVTSAFLPVFPAKNSGNWLAWSRLRQKSGHFLSDEANFCRP
jgi:hypothetical protein